MPWKECNAMGERLRFAAKLLEGDKLPNVHWSYVPMAAQGLYRSPELPDNEKQTGNR